MTRDARIQKHIDALGDPNLNRSSRAETYLIRYYIDSIFDRMLLLAESDTPLVRLRAGWILAHTGRPEAFEVLTKLADDPDARVRYDSLIALGILGGERSKRFLMERAQTQSEDGAALYGLAKMGLEVFDDVIASSCVP